MLRIASNISVTGIINAFGKHVVKSTKKEKKKKSNEKNQRKSRGMGRTELNRASKNRERKTKQKDALFCPTKGKLHVNTFIKLGNQYGCVVEFVLPNHDILVSKSEF